MTCLWTASLTARSCNLKQFFVFPSCYEICLLIKCVVSTWNLVFCGQKLFSSWGKKPSPTSNQNQLAISSVVYMWATSVTPSVTVKSPGPLSVHQSNDSAGGRWQCLNCWSLYVVSHLMKHQAAASNDRPTCLSETTQPKRDGTHPWWNPCAGGRLQDFRCLGAALVKTNEFEHEQGKHTHLPKQAILDRNDLGPIP